MKPDQARFENDWPGGKISFISCFYFSSSVMAAQKLKWSVNKSGNEPSMFFIVGLAVGGGEKTIFIIFLFYLLIANIKYSKKTKFKKTWPFFFKFPNKFLTFWLIIITFFHVFNFPFSSLSDNVPFLLSFSKTARAPPSKGTVRTSHELWFYSNLEFGNNNETEEEEKQGKIEKSAVLTTLGQNLFWAFSKVNFKNVIGLFYNRRGWNPKIFKHLFFPTDFDCQ